MSQVTHNPSEKYVERISWKYYCKYHAISTLNTVNISIFSK